MERPTEIIVIGANGRMGRTIINLVNSEDAFKLAGAVENAANVKALTGLSCPVSDNLAEVMQESPNAVLVDFTAPEASFANARLAAAQERRMVIGTTGLSAAQKEELSEFAKKTPLLWSANMSVGINVMLAVLPRLARALGANYDMEIVETHHRHKKDAPSGTALMLEEALAASRCWDAQAARISCRDGQTGERADKQIGVMALRGGDVAGIHSCYFFGPGEFIEVKHVAESRENFAQGALRAARWLASMPAGRLYSMQDVIDANTERE